MNDMKEIIDARTVELIMTAILIGGPLAGAAIGAAVGVMRKNVGRRTLQGFGYGCFGILNYVLWRFYSYMVRWDPATGYVGLHKVSVLLINLAVFVAVGVVIGLIWGYRTRRGIQP